MDDLTQIKCYRIWKLGTDSLHDPAGYFADTVTAFKVRRPGVVLPDADDMESWDYIQVVTRRSYRRWLFSNDGAQGWRHKATGFTIPDHCRMVSGCPEVWGRTRKRQLWLHADSPIFDYVLEYA